MVPDMGAALYAGCSVELTHGRVSGKPGEKPSFGRTSLFLFLLVKTCYGFDHLATICSQCCDAYIGYLQVSKFFWRPTVANGGENCNRHRN